MKPSNQRRTETPRYFQIGVVPTCIGSHMPALMEQYTSLYGRWEASEPIPDAVSIEVKKQPFSLWHRQRYEIIANEHMRYEPSRDEEVFPYVEWSINWEVPRIMPQYLQLHASSMELDGQGVIFRANRAAEVDADRGSAVARLAVSVRRVRPDPRRHARVAPLPAGHLHQEAVVPVLEELGLTPHKNRLFIKGAKGCVGFIDPLSAHPDAIGEPCPIRHVIFPRYVEGAEPRLEPISRGQAAFDLHAVCFNLLGCKSLGLDVIAEMIRGAECYKLTSGKIHATCDVVEALVRGGCPLAV